METMQQAGLNVKMSTPEAAVWTSALISGEYSMTLNALASAADPYFPYIRSFNPDDFGKSRFTAPHWSNEEVTKLLSEYKQSKDADARTAAMDKLQLIIAEAMPIVPLYNSPSFYEYNTKRFTGWADAENPKYSPVVSNANSARVLQLLDLKPVAQ
jgi:peptide/nickel transport system substrate-binding protein